MILKIKRINVNINPFFINYFIYLSSKISS